MRAILLKDFGDADQLYLGQAPDPVIASEEVLVKVKASALNRADLLQRRGLYPPPPGESEILGLEVAGEIVALGTEVSDHQIGDRVMALLAGGGYAELAKVNAAMLMPLPDHMTWEQAAAIPEAFLTAWQAVNDLAQLQKGEKILIHAGASGVGSAAIQIAKKIGAAIIVTASAGKHAFCQNLGAQLCIDYKTEEFAEVLKTQYPDGVHVVIDFVGAPYFHQNIQTLSMDGRMVHLGFLGGTQLDQFNLMALLRKRLHLMGSTLRARTLDYKIQLTQGFVQNCLDDFTTGNIRPLVDTVYSWKDVIDAHQYMEANKNQGKIVLRMD